MNNTNKKLVDKDAKKLGAKILVLKLKKNNQPAKSRVLIKVKYSSCIEVHLRDNLHSSTNISILESINDVQEQIISALGIHDIRLKFLQDSRWFLYGYDGTIREFCYGELEPIDLDSGHLDQDFLKLTLTLDSTPDITFDVSIPKKQKKKIINKKHHQLELHLI
ncbi:TPA: hypothetical protein QCU37_005054 [Bacillus cereus]|nr:hypothetical protein [Bacillus cereus]